MFAAAQGDAAQLERMSFQYDRHAVTCMLVRHYTKLENFLNFEELMTYRAPGNF